MSGRLIGLFLLAVAVIGGVGIWYLQIHAFYEEVPASGPRDVVLTPQGGGAPEPVAHGDFRAIDSASSPIRYRACFTVEAERAALAEDYVTLDDAVPLVAPGWFDCFDAGAIGAALEAGRATAFMSVAQLEYGIDRVVAVFEDGRGVAWNRINACGAAFFDGDPVPPGCPPPPET